MPEKPDSELVQAAISGDADSFTQLCRRYYPAMVAIAHSVLGDRHLAEDAAQQGFANAVRKLPQLKRKDRFVGWLAVICRNTAKDMSKSIKPLGSSEGLCSIAAGAQQDSSAAIVRQAVAELPAADREVIFLRFYDGMTYEQMSAVLGISEQAINGKLRRAKIKIADYLRREGFARVRL